MRSTTCGGAPWKARRCCSREPPGLALLEQADQVVGVLLLHRENPLKHALGGSVLVADVLDHLAIAVDCDVLGEWSRTAPGAMPIG
jgi:hypothetical protein